MEGSEQEMTGAAAQPQEVFDQEQYDQQWEAQRSRYFAVLEARQERLGEIVVRKVADESDRPDLDAPRNIIQEVSDEAKCSLQDAQLAFWTAHNRGQIEWTGNWFSPTEAGRRILDKEPTQGT